MDNLTFTPAERRELMSGLRRIWRAESVKPDSPTARLLLTRLTDTASAGVPRDEFGLNRAVLAVQSIALAVESMGLRGPALTAYLISEVCTEADAVALAAEFGSEVKAAAEALLRVKAIEAKTEALRTDNFRNLLVSQAGDMRVVLLLIAGCVERMRRIKDSDNDVARRDVSTEAAYVYAPLAHKLGLYKLKSELEDLSLKYLEHDAYYRIKENLNATKKSRDAYIERFIAPIRKMLDAEGMRYHIKGRTKSIHSIWQ